MIVNLNVFSVDCKKMKCEEKVKSFFNKNCTNSIHKQTTERVVSTPYCIEPTPVTHIIIVTQNCSAPMIIETTDRPNAFAVTTPPGSKLQDTVTHQQTVPEPTNLSPMSSTLGSTTSTTALGVLLGLSVLSLVVVTAGWVWTCLALKKKEVIKRGTQKRYSYVTLSAA